MNNQGEAFNKLNKLKVGALFMEMGTGKTKVALDLINSKINKINYILYICPFSIKEEIKRECQKWYKELSNFEIVGCETISSSDKEYVKLLNKVQSNDTFMIVDESLKIKNREALRTKRIINIGKSAKYKLILNGTPISKNVLDIYTQMEFLSPKILNMSFNEYKNKYCEYYLNGKLKNKVLKQYNVENLISIISPYIYECRLEIKSNKNYASRNYNILCEEEYESIKRKFLNYDTDISFFALTTSLQHYYCSQKEKMQLVDKLQEEIQGQVLVFVKFIDSIPENAHRVSGDTSEEEREKEIIGFKENKFKTLYITYGCGNFGLNFQNCSNLIFADHTFDYAQRLQAEARIYRMGQKENVNIYDINCNCGLDKLIRACLNKKTRLLVEVKKEIGKKGAEKWLKTI